MCDLTIYNQGSPTDFTATTRRANGPPQKGGPIFCDSLSLLRYHICMNILKRSLTVVSSLAVAVLSVGCGHAQVKPTAYQVALSWKAPAVSGSWTGCTTAAPCTYVASRIILDPGTATCPAANTATPNYTPLNTSTPSTTVAYTDSNASGLTACYVVQTMQGSAVSVPSNVAGPFVVPASPLAPSLSGNQTVAQESPKPVGNREAPILTAKLTPVR